MKKTLFAVAISLTIPSAALCKISSSGNARDIIVTTQDMWITQDGDQKHNAIISLQSPQIEYKIQHGNGIIEPLTISGFTTLWANAKNADSFAKLAPNARLSFWDPGEENYYEAEFYIENVVKTNSGKIQLHVQFIDSQNPIRITNVSTARNQGKIRDVTLTIRQIEDHLNQNKTPGVLTVDSSPWDPRKSAS